MAYSYLLGGCRTPIGRLLGRLSSVPAPDLAATALRETLQRLAVDPSAIDEVILGNVLGAGIGQAPARQAALAAGLPDTVAAVTVNKVCGSGLKAAMIADQAIRAGDANRIVAGGMESMSRAPYLLDQGARGGFKFGHRQLLDSMLHDGLWCPFENHPMGASAEFIARQYGVSREAQDRFAVESHRRAVAAGDSMQREIVPVDGLASEDEGPRPDTSLEKLGCLPPAFESDGTVTAGNASQISDGAATLIVASEDVAKRYPTGSKFRVLATATAGVPPREIFIAPVAAMNAAIAKTKLELIDIDLIELNEAFAAQCLACMQTMKLRSDRVNVRGGAIALGHPIGASGGRILVSLMHTLEDTDNTIGLACLCLGGGNAVAMVLERV